MPSVISPAWVPDPHLASDRKNDNDKSGNVCINSPLLFQTLKNLSVDEKYCVLDLGPAHQNSIDFFGDYWCKLFIADAISELCLPVRQSDDASHVWQDQLPESIVLNQTQSTPLDLIFLWSLPNYLTPQQLKSLIEYLRPHSSERVKLHAYIFNTQMMPVIPATYHITRQNKVEITPRSTGLTNCPLYHLADLHTCLNPYKADHSVMLSSGIQEYVFSA